jgi:hypothetical protein
MDIDKLDAATASSSSAKPSKKTQGAPKIRKETVQVTRAKTAAPTPKDNNTRLKELTFCKPIADNNTNKSCAHREPSASALLRTVLSNNVNKNLLKQWFYQVEGTNTSHLISADHLVGVDRHQKVD